MVLYQYDNLSHKKATTYQRLNGPYQEIHQYILILVPLSKRFYRLYYFLDDWKDKFYNEFLRDF